MPYIKTDRRNDLKSDSESDPHYDYVFGDAKTAGELNYVFTVLVQWYFKKNGANYQAINDVVGALEACKLEFYRRVAVPYEDKKIKENGDVY